MNLNKLYQLATFFGIVDQFIENILYFFDKHKFLAIITKNEKTIY